jgi:membrane protein
VLALYFSSSGIEALRIGLNRAYNIRDPRPWWLLRLESTGYVLVGASSLLLLALLVVFAPLLWNNALFYVPSLEPMWAIFTIARFFISSLFLTIALVIAHKWLPAGDRSFLQIAPGIALTLALSLVFAIAFGQYLTEFARNYVSTYAGLASVMIALVFLYTLACIFLAGGEFNAAIWRHKARARAAESSSG